MVMSLFRSLRAITPQDIITVSMGLSMVNTTYIQRQKGAVALRTTPTDLAKEMTGFAHWLLGPSSAIQLNYKPRIKPRGCAVNPEQMTRIEPRQRFPLRGSMSNSLMGKTISLGTAILFRDRTLAATMAIDAGQPSRLLLGASPSAYKP